MPIITVSANNIPMFGYESSIISDKPLFDIDGYFSSQYGAELFWLTANRVARLSHICQKYSPRQESREFITKQEIYEIVVQTLEWVMIGERTEPILVIPKQRYKLVDIDALKAFLAVNPVSEREYDADSHDCDDFAFGLLGDIRRWDPELAFFYCSVNANYLTKDGTVKTMSHAINAFIGTDREVLFVEPQNDQIGKCPMDAPCSDIWFFNTKPKAMYF